MLDDFGLRAALEWHVRDFTGRCGIEVDLCIDGDFDSLPDRHRTCVYRAVQEALTNCVRHAHAIHVTVSVATTAKQLDVAVTDDGTGLEPTRRRKDSDCEVSKSASRSSTAHWFWRRRQEAGAPDWLFACPCHPPKRPRRSSELRADVQLPKSAPPSSPGFRSPGECNSRADFGES